MGAAMSVTRGADHEGSEATPGEAGVVPVALGRRVEVIGDLLLPAVPTDCSLATIRDIAHRLDEWQGPGIVIVCGRLVAPGCHGVQA